MQKTSLKHTHKKSRKTRKQIDSYYKTYSSLTRKAVTSGLLHTADYVSIDCHYITSDYNIAKLTDRTSD